MNNKPKKAVGRNSAEIKHHRKYLEFYITRDGQILLSDLTKDTLPVLEAISESKDAITGNIYCG